MNGAIEADRAAFAADYDVDARLLARFDLYAARLADGQARANLVGPATIAEVWTRHFADSAQLRALGSGVWLDLGAGAGFPGLVLALLGARVHLIEATGKKASFLRETIDALALGERATLHHGRIEAISAFPVDTVTARALAPLATLFDYGARFAAQDGRFVLPKGARVGEEMMAARARFEFEAALVPSRTSDTGRIVIAHGVRARGVRATGSR